MNYFFLLVQGFCVETAVDACDDRRFEMGAKPTNLLTKGQIRLMFTNKKEIKLSGN